MEKTFPQSRVLFAFIALAILPGPVESFVYSALGFGAQYLSPALVAASSGLAGLALLALALICREKLPPASGLLALVALFLPPWLEGMLSSPTIRSVAWLHETPWGVPFFISLAAPLWLALLSALQWIPEQVPRAIAGAAIAGIGAACLITPGTAWTISLNPIPVAVLHILLAVLTVFSWSFARPRLATSSTAATAGCFLLLTVLGQIVLAPLRSHDQPYSLSLREALIPLLLATLLNAGIWWLWFWLLQRMSLAVFSLHALAAWLAALVPGFFMLGFLSWRADAAVLIGLAALVIALRARTSDEHPLALGLASP